VMTDDTGANASAAVPRPLGLLLDAAAPFTPMSSVATVVDGRHEIPALRTLLAHSGRRGIQRSGIKEEPAGRGTAAELSAMPSWVHAYQAPAWIFHAAASATWASQFLYSQANFTT